jgi:hypothetical protein
MKKKLYIASIAMGIAVMATAFVAAADSTQNGMMSQMSKSQQPILQVGAAGKVQMRGTIASVASGMLTVNSWGGAWTVNVGASARIFPAATSTTQFKAGDFVGVQGTVSQSASLTIDATFVRDWTLPATMVKQNENNGQSSEGGTKSGPRNFVGVASNLNGSMFTLTVNGMAESVIVSPGAQVVNRNRLTIPLASIQSGDSVRVSGVNASGTITAQIVRDMSIPPSSTSTRL